jgi:chaperonin GroEL (HSP60 family)
MQTTEGMKFDRGYISPFFVTSAKSTYLFWLLLSLR